MSIEFWFEFGSTYSYPAATRVSRLLAAAEIPLVWRPFLLGPIFSEQGWNTSPFNIYPAKGRYMWRDMERTCAELGVDFRRPSVFPRNGLLAARIACQFSESPWIAEFVRGVYVANFARDLEISEPEVLAAVLRSLAQEPAPILERAQRPEAKAALRAQCDRAAEYGIFGAPMLRVGTELFWGNDRLEAAVRWHQEHPK